MKSKVSFWIAFGMVLLAAGGLCAYFAVNAVEIAKTHTEPQVTAAILQMVFAFGAFAMVFLKQAKKYWFALPLLLIAFAAVDILTINRCPMCNSIYQ